MSIFQAIGRRIGEQAAHEAIAARLPEILEALAQPKRPILPCRTYGHSWTESARWLEDCILALDLNCPVDRECCKRMLIELVRFKVNALGDVRGSGDSL